MWIGRTLRASLPSHPSVIVSRSSFSSPLYSQHRHMSSIGGNWKDLFKAAEEGDEYLATYHLEQGVNPNYQHPEYFTSPLFGAVRRGHLNIVQLLIEKGSASPTQIEELSSQTPLEAALEHQQHDIIDYLHTVIPPDQCLPVRHVLVTGGNRGIGKAICESLLHKGHRVLFTCRSPEIGETTRQELTETTKNRKVDYVVGNLSSVAATRALAQSIPQRLPTLNTVVHNAAVWQRQLETNEDGLEMTFMVNYMAPYILTQELDALLQQNGPSRIVLVSGKGYKWGKADVDKTPTGKDFGRFISLCNSKQCGMLWFGSLVQKYAKYNADHKDKTVTVTAVHPGIIDTHLGHSTKEDIWSWLIRTLKQTYCDTPETGALGAVWLAEHDDAANCHGKFYNGQKECTVQANVQDSARQQTWGKWTNDFLANRPKL